MCSTCWLTLESFHKFYLAVDEAKENYLTKCTDSDTCEDISDIIGDAADNVSCKAEPPVLIEYVQDLLPFSNTAENNVGCNFERGHFEPDATIDKRDFDAIFLDEFSNECDIKIEKTTLAERYMEHSESQQHDLMASVKVTTRNRTSPRSNAAKCNPRECRKRSAEHSIANLSDKYSENPSHSGKNGKRQEEPVFNDDDADDDASTQREVCQRMTVDL